MYRKDCSQTIIMIFKRIYLFVICFVVISIKSTSLEHYDVAFVHVLFRHGDSTPTHLYRNDPNPWYEFNPPGLGRLTKHGENRAYQLGLVLRDRYKNFLEWNSNMPRRVRVHSTDSQRTKESMELALQALRKPDNQTLLEYVFSKKGTDTLLFPKNLNAYRHELDKVRHQSDVKAKVNKLQSLMDKLSKWTGQPTKTTGDVAGIYHILAAESAMGLQITHWAQDKHIRRQIKKATILDYQIYNYNTALKKSFGGVLLEEIANTMEMKATNKIKSGCMQLLCAHGTTIVALLSALGVYEPHVPKYSSAVIVELLQDRHQKYYTRILHYENILTTARILPVPGCSMDPCPLHEFQRLIQPMMP